MSETTHFRTCPLCEATCGLEITVRDDAVARIRGDVDDVFSKGFICPKGSTLKQLDEDPDRIRTPLVKKNGSHVAVSWGEAFAAVEQGLGGIWADGERDAVAVYLGNPTVHSTAGVMLNPVLIKTLGTKNVYSASTVDQMPKHVSSGFLFGHATTIPVPDLDRTDYLLMLGANPFASNGSLCTAPDFPGRLRAISARGGRVVVVDPRRSETAKAADEHVAIRPGTDALWLAALVTEIERAGHVDLGDLADHVDGLDRTLAALSPFDADSVAARTRIGAETTRRIAAEVAGSASAAVYGRIGTQTTTHGTLAAWLVDVINVVTGNLDRPGGAMFPAAAHSAPTAGRAPGGRGFKIGRWTSRVSEHPEVRGELPVAALAEEIETPGAGRVRGLVTFGGNPVRSCPNSERLDAAFATLDFMVSVDIYVNETTRHADVILPSPSPLARPHYDLAFYGLGVRNIANYSPPLRAADAAGEPGQEEHHILGRLILMALGLPDGDPDDVLWSVFEDRAKRGGLDPAAARAARADMAAIDAVVDVMLATGPYDLSLEKLLDNPHGIDLGPLEPRLPELLRTATGKVELAADPLIADVTRLEAMLSDESDGQLLLVGRRQLRSNNSWMHNLDVLVRGRSRCTLQMNPADADAIGLGDAGRAAVRSEAGTIEATVEVTDDIATGTVSLPHGWGHDVDGVAMSVASATDGVNSNALTDDAGIDPLSGNARLNAIPVEVTPA